MAINKRKVLEAARKFAQKGAKERALKEYNLLLKEDPRDAKLMLEIGDVHRRWGQVDEAIAQYSRVADQYKQEGFDARAVAVFKQILNLDSKRYTSHVALSELYQRMGLDAEAVAALQTAADGYHKEGKKREALDLLRRMSGLDPSNTTSRMKVADLLRQEGMEDDAVSEYEAVVSELERQGALDTVTAVYERILEIMPQRIETLIGLVRNLIAQGQPERAEPFAKRICDADPDVPEHCELLIDVYGALGREDDLNAATRDLAKLYRARGDDERAREILQRLPSVDSFELSGLQPALDSPDDDPMPEFETASPPDLRAGGDLLGDEDSLIGDGDGGLLDDDQLLDDDFLMADEDLELDDELGGAGVEEPVAAEPTSVEPSPAPVVAEASDAPLDVPEGDPEQLFAEASVYLRYGKRTQAIESLRAILLAEPEHRPALEKLGEAYAEEGAEGDAVEVWSRAAQIARDAGDTNSFEILRDRIESFDPDAAASLGPSAEADPAPDLELDIDIDVEDAVGAESPSADDSAIGLDFEVDVDTDEPLAEEASDGVEMDIDIDIDIDGYGEDRTDAIEIDGDAFGDDAMALRADAGATLASSEAEQALDLGGVDLADEEEDLEEVFDDTPMPVGGAQRTPAGSSTAAEQVAEDLEEAEFYFQQGLFDEAEAIYRRVLEIAPSHPSALLRMGEIAVARGGSATGSAAAEPDLGLAADATSSDALSDPTLGADPPADEDEPAYESASADDFSEVAIDDEGDAPSAALESPTLVDEPVPPELLARESADAEVDVESETSAALDDEGGFDLAAELADSFDDEEDEAGKSQTDMVLSEVENGFESIFSDFKKGVSQQLGEGDMETRYDLGIAYMEMGLHEDASAEFQLCLESDARRLNCLHMMGLCSLHLERFADAIGNLQQALALPDVPANERPGLYFDLGRALQQSGDLEAARTAYETVRSSDAGFPGINRQIASLEEGDGDTDGGDDDEMESFDDFLADIEAEPTEEAETFADVIAEADVITEPEPDDTATGRRSKKKISFV